LREHEGIRKKKEGRTRALEDEEGVGEERDQEGEERDKERFSCWEKKNRLRKISSKDALAWKECDGCVWSGHDCSSIARQRSVEKKG
jgi:hypothetical protein